MRRVVVVGGPGAGKTTIAAALAEALDVPHVELDGLWWGPDWTPVGGDEFRSRLRELAGRGSWVADGNYVDVGAVEVLWPAADLLVWLDPPRTRSVVRAVRRTAARALRRELLWADNRQRLRDLGPRSVARLHHRWPSYSARIGEVLAAGEDDLEVVRIRTDVERRTLLERAGRWDAPLPGTWLRNFRLGEWLPEPVTPLFETWLLPAIERSAFPVLSAQARPLHVVVHGWYFNAPGGVRQLLRSALRRPVAFLVTFGLTRWRPDLTERWSVARAEREWERDVAPAYAAAVARAETALTVEADVPLATLVALIDDVAAAAGRTFGSITKVAGFAWKVEMTLRTFVARHLASTVEGDASMLVSSLGPGWASPPGHAVHSLDWVHPTAGESPAAVAVGGETDSSARVELESRCRAALVPRRRGRFDRLLAVAQNSARRRERQVADLTLGWPALRAAALRLGGHLSASQVIEEPEDVFFLTRVEVEAALAMPSGRAGTVATRRRRWEEQRTLTPPERLGPPSLLDRFGAPDRSSRPDRPTGGDVVVGTGASPGVHTGVARIIRSPAELDRMGDGDVLVAPLTTPAWAPLVARAGAVVTEGGTLFAHASIVAREFGIPAVVGAAGALARIIDGGLVTVDGSAGVVRPADHPS